MTIPKDKLYHLAVGATTAVGVIVVSIAGRHGGIGAAMAAATTMMGVAIEAYQWARKEGQVEALDAIATAAPGWLLWAGLALAGRS